jgi:hypothetical protein
MTAVRATNLIANMYAANASIVAAIFATNNPPTSRPSKVPVAVRRQAVVPRSQPGPVLETMLKNWPKSRIVAEIVSLSAAREMADHDNDSLALEVVDREIAKVAGLCEQHELKESGFTQRVWEQVDEVTASGKAHGPVDKDLLKVVHGTNVPGTLGAELTDELRQALYQIATPVPAAEAPVVESPDDIVNRAMSELANNQESSI